MHEVMETTLDWTIVCPGGLTDDEATEKVRVSLDTRAAPDSSCETSRANLAAALVACLDQPATVGKSFTLFDGDTPLTEALRFG